LRARRYNMRRPVYVREWKTSVHSAAVRFVGNRQCGEIAFRAELKLWWPPLCHTCKYRLISTVCWLRCVAFRSVQLKLHFRCPAGVSNHFLGSGKMEVKVCSQHNPQQTAVLSFLINPSFLAGNPSYQMATVLTKRTVSVDPDSKSRVIKRCHECFLSITIHPFYQAMKIIITERATKESSTAVLASEDPTGLCCSCEVCESSNLTPRICTSSLQQGRKVGSDQDER
jgi:hypothetical protein